MAATPISFDGFTLQAEPSYVTSRISHYLLSTRKLSLFELANADGSVITGDKRTQKLIVAEGKIGPFATQALLESAIDTLTAALRGKEKFLDIGYAGGTRRYVASVQNDGGIEYIGPTLASFSIEFICADPFGHDTVLANPLSVVTNTAAAFRAALTVGSSYPVSPIVNIKLNSYTGGTNKFLKIANPANLSSIQINRNFDTSYAIDFNASGHHITNASSDFEMAGAVTVSTWLKADANAGTVINKHDSSSPFKSFILDYSGTTVRFGVTNISGTFVAATDTTTRTAGSWVHYVGVYDGAFVRLYVNGVLVASAAQTGLIRTVSTDPLYIGSFDTTTVPYNGQLKSIRIWNYALSSREVERVFYANYAPRNGLVLEYLMTQGSGTSLQDTSGRSNHGTITSATWVSAFTEIVMDSERKNFTYNGSSVDYSGNFPTLQPGAAALDISDTLSTRSYTYTIAYDRRYQ